MTNVDLFGEELNSVGFSYELCSLKQCETNDVYANFTKYTIFKDNYICLGWCDAIKLAVRPKTEGVAVMLFNKETETEFWIHISNCIIQCIKDYRK